MISYAHQELENKIRNLERKVNDLDYEISRLKDELSRKVDRSHTHPYEEPLRF